MRSSESGPALSDTNCMGSSRHVHPDRRAQARFSEVTCLHVTAAERNTGVDPALSYERRNISAMISATCAEEAECVDGEIMQIG